MPLDPTLGLRIALDTFWYYLLLNLAALHWGLLRGFIMMGYLVEVINRWLGDNAFAPLVGMTNSTLEVAVGLAFIVALLVLGITYLMAAFIRLDVVAPRSALLWYAAGLLFFSLGPALYSGMNEFRLLLSEGFYLSALSGIEGSAGGAFSSLGQVEESGLDIGPICDHLGVYLPGATGAGRVDGLDVALAYLRADGPDVMGYPQPLYSPGCPPHLLNPVTGAYVSSIPQEWYFPGSYFDVTQGPPLVFDTMTDAARAASIAVASSSQGRLLTAWPLVLFGVVEQLTYLLITVAQGLTFVSFGIAILFAFFKRTEMIAQAVVNQWIELIVQTVIIALVQALVVALFLAGTAAGSGMVVFGIGLICLVFMLITLWSGVKAVWNAFNRLFGAMGQAAGGTITTPGAAGGVMAAAGLATAGGLAVVGSSALAGMGALRDGATPAQAAGLALGGMSGLSSAARTLAYLPGVRETSLGEAAEQFTEGAVVRRVAGPMVGKMLLTDRDPDAVQLDTQGRLLGRPMLVPAVGEGLEGWTVPVGKRRANTVQAEEDVFDGETGELVSLRAGGKAKRMGTFTPVTPPSEASDEARERERYADDLRGEELEAHIADVARSNGGGEKDGDNRLDRAASGLEGSAEALGRAAGMVVGSLQVSGRGDVLGVLRDALALLGSRGAAGVDHLQTGVLLARAVGITPVGDEPPVRENLARFGMFLSSAARLGLSPEQVEQVGREAAESPDGRFSPETRAQLLEGVLATGRTRDDAEREVSRLEIAARLLPDQLVAFGAMPVPAITVEPAVAVQVNLPDGDNMMNTNAAMSGSGAVLGGGE